jgi:photosystem II stability/assembly factor-like uncharacterized protein
MTQRWTRTCLLLTLLTLTAAGSYIGRSFSAEMTSVSKLSGETHFHGIAVDPRDADRLFLATHHGLFVVGPDGGAQRVSETEDDFMGFTPHPADPDVLYASGHPAGGGNLGFIMSKDGGRTWQTVGNGAYGASDFHQMTVSPVDPSVAFGIYGTELQASRDGGRSWKVVSQIPDRIFSLAASSQSENGLYAASAAGLLYSPDGGRSWTRRTGRNKPVTAVFTTPEGSILIFVVGDGLLQASEPALEWQPVSNDFGTAIPIHLAVARSDQGRTAYAVTIDPETHYQALLVSRDGGRRWHPLGAEQE